MTRPTRSCGRFDHSGISAMEIVRNSRLDRSVEAGGRNIYRAEFRFFSESDRTETIDV
jgi:hypothetical protein